MSKKYPMMVTLKEASRIYRRRAAKYREKRGFLPIQAPVHKGLHTSARKLREAVTLTKLREERIE